jgi:hypothetical protein
MIFPEKHEDLSKNILVLGADVLAIFKTNSYLPCNIEELYQKIKNKRYISLEQFFDVVLFLWLINAVELDDHLIIPSQ